MVRTESSGSTEKAFSSKPVSPLGYEAAPVGNVTAELVKVIALA